MLSLYSILILVKVIFLEFIKLSLQVYLTKLNIVSQLIQLYSKGMLQMIN